MLLLPKCNFISRKPCTFCGTLKKKKRSDLHRVIVFLLLAHTCMECNQNCMSSKYNFFIIFLKNFCRKFPERENILQIQLRINGPGCSWWCVGVCSVRGGGGGGGSWYTLHPLLPSENSLNPTAYLIKDSGSSGGGPTRIHGL